MKTSAELIKVGTDAAYIETASGKRFRLESPEFDPYDIAHATAHQCRFAGHTKEFYSVAKHMCMVHDIMVERGDPNPFEGLMHDAHEAYVIDMPSPWKPYVKGYVDVEKALEAKMRKWAGLPTKVSDACKMADWIALYIEAFFLLPSKGSEWTYGSEYRQEARKMIGRNCYWFDVYFDSDHDWYNEWLNIYWSYNVNAPVQK